MHTFLKDLIQHVAFTGDLKQDVQLFLTANQCPEAAEHCMEVGRQSKIVAEQFGANAEAAEISGWLHDISAVIPNHERIHAARELQIDILPEEEVFPMIIHQKLSKVMAAEIFNITDQEILDAVGCHTTLRSRATLLDQVLFVADKIAWDQTGDPPYIQELLANLQLSLRHGAFSYINYLWQRRENLKVVHPWLREAYEELKDTLG